MSHRQMLPWEAALLPSPVGCAGQLASAAQAPAPNRCPLTPQWAPSLPRLWLDMAVGHVDLLPPTLRGP